VSLCAEDRTRRIMVAMTRTLPLAVVHLGVLLAPGLFAAFSQL
jgi:hypothetical protein